jgi:hypothetical protein
MLIRHFFSQASSWSRWIQSWLQTNVSTVMNQQVTFQWVMIDAPFTIHPRILMPAPGVGELASLLDLGGIQVQDLV